MIRQFGLVAVAALCATSMAQTVEITVNGERVDTSDAPPQVYGSRVLVPVRGVLERAGATVTWDPQTRTVRAIGNDRRVLLQIGSQTGQVNDQPVRMDVPAQIIQARTMVPLRFLAEGLGMAVQYNERNRLVAITTGGRIVQNPPPDTGSANQALGVTLSIRGFQYEPNVIRVRPGQRVSVRVVNRSNGQRTVSFNLRNGGVALEKPLRAGETGYVVFDAPDRPGRYTFYSTIGNQRQRGLTGTLIVE